MRQQQQTNTTSIYELPYPLPQDGDEELSGDDLLCGAGRSPLEDLLSEEIGALMGRAFDRLPDNERFVLCSYYYEGLTLREIGKELGVSESRICHIRTRALRRLRDVLHRFTFDDLSLVVM